jgi:hypothetical protein
VFTAKFGNKARAASAALVIVGGGLLLALGPSSMAQNAPPKIIGPATDATAPKGAIPLASGARLSRLDGLRAMLEEEKLLRDIAKVRAEARDARAPSVAPMTSAPVPLSSFPSVASLDVPPLPPRANMSFSSSPSRSSGAGIAVLEAWGSGTRQARVTVDGNERLVRVGDRIGGATVTDISNGELTLLDTKGRKRKIN